MTRDNDLSEKDLNRLVTLLNPLYVDGVGDRVSYPLLSLLIRSDVSKDSALKLFKLLKGDRGLVEAIYNETSLVSDIRSLSDILILNGWNNRSARDLERSVQRIVKYDPWKGLVIARTGTNRAIVNSTPSKQIIYLKEEVRNGRDQSTETVVLEACLESLVVFDSPLRGEPKRFTATFKPSAYKNTLVIGPALIDEITAYLLESGLVVANRLVKDALPALFNAFIESGVAEVRDGLEYPGFYQKNPNKLSVVGYGLESVSDGDLRDALCFLEELVGFFPDQKIKLAHVLKWGLLAPFSFVLKQRGKWMPWLLLYGKAGSGKTTLADMVLYLWGRPESGVNDLGGSGFNTEARIGEKLRCSCFPLVVNEPGGVFEKPALVELLKTAVERTTSRGRFEGRSYKTILALAPVIFTSNHVPPSDDALIRRLDVINFSYAERKDENEKKAFREEFNIDSVDACMFHRLKPLAQFFTCCIVDKPSLLDENWKILANRLLKHAYQCVGMLMPLWLVGWSGTESLEDLDNLLVERVRVFLQREVNKAHNMYNSGVALEDMDRRILYVLCERLVPWLFLGKNNKVYLSIGFVDALKKYGDVDESLKSIAELLGWSYQNSRVRGGFKGRCIVVDLIVFTDFVFP